MWSNDPESYAGSSVATGRASHTTQAKSEDPHKKGYPGPPRWGLGVGLTTPFHIKKIVTELTGSQNPPSAVVLLMMVMTKKDQM